MSNNDALAQGFFRAPTTTYPQPVPYGVKVDGREGAEYPVGSSPWWLARLLATMNRRNIRLSELRAYYLGENPTWHLADRAHRETFGTRFQNLRANLAQPIVEIPEQRMTVIGMDLVDDPSGSDAAWRMWQDNELDADSSDAHLSVLSLGECPVIVGPGDGSPIITVEDPLQVYVETGWVNRRRKLAGIKHWIDDSGSRVAVLYLPDRIEWWRTTDRQDTSESPKWAPMEGLTRLNPLGEVPIVILRNRQGRGEHEGIISQLDMYAATLYQMVTAAHHLSFPQRWATGIEDDSESPELDAEGVPVTPAPTVATGPDTFVTSESPDASFGNFQASDLAGFITELDAIRSDIGTITHTPHRLLLPPPTSVPPTGESVRFQDAGLTHKVVRTETKVGNGWESVVRMAFRTVGDTVRGSRMDMETVWADPELQAESTHIDALVKMQAMGVPQEELWRRMGATPQQIRRWKAQQPPPATSDPADPAHMSTGDAS